jgi:phosphate transport system substrate-binding protein
MKKALALAAAFCLLLCFTACSGGAQTSPDETALPSASPPQVEFVFSRDNFPVMDGSTATVPLGQAVACVLLGEPRDRVADLAQFNRTTESFYNLMDGNADILIVGEPNPSVFETMKAAGFEYEISPIATDALVFLVNADNPVDSLTTEQIQRIYTGEITNWKDVGGADLEIQAFQRVKNAGSQALMEKHVMAGLRMTDPPEAYAIEAMGELITAVRNYDGSASAIGYTVYYYANDMKMADGLKILAVNDIAPNDETIASGEYPFLNPYYTVISAGQPEDSPARILYEWLLSPEGQNLIKSEGYVPVAGQEGP